MKPYDEAYLEDVVETQGKLFGYVAEHYNEKDTEDFINFYMQSKTRKSIDEGQAYVATMNVTELWSYFMEVDSYKLKEGKALEGFMPFWIGEFYAYYQWYYNIPSCKLIKKIPLAFLEKVYWGFHDLDLTLAAEKVECVK